MPNTVDPQISHTSVQLGYNSEFLDRLLRLDNLLYNGSRSSGKHLLLVVYYKGYFFYKSYYEEYKWIARWRDTYITWSGKDWNGGASDPKEFGFFTNPEALHTCLLGILWRFHFVSMTDSIIDSWWLHSVSRPLR